MPNDVKAIVSAVTLIVAGVLAYWSGSPIRPEYSTFENKPMFLMGPGGN